MAQTPSIGLFYGSSTCYTEMAAEKIRDALPDHAVQLFNIADHPIFECLEFDLVIMGIPTWDYGELQEDWEEIWEDLDELPLDNKVVALYGMGDQVGYPEWFLDALGYLHHKVVQQGAKVIGYWPNEGYEYEESKALTEDKSQFVGLALDDENQFMLSDARIAGWCQQILTEYQTTLSD